MSVSTRYLLLGSGWMVYKPLVGILNGDISVAFKLATCSGVMVFCPWSATNTLVLPFCKVSLVTICLPVESMVTSPSDAFLETSIVWLLPVTSFSFFMYLLNWPAIASCFLTSIFVSVVTALSVFVFPSTLLFSATVLSILSASFSLLVIIVPSEEVTMLLIDLALIFTDWFPCTIAPYPGIFVLSSLWIELVLSIVL